MNKKNIKKIFRNIKFKVGSQVPPSHQYPPLNGRNTNDFFAFNIFLRYTTSQNLQFSLTCRWWQKKTKNIFLYFTHFYR